MKFAVLKTGGKQYNVTVGQTVNIEKIAGNAGDKVLFDQILLTGEDTGDVKIGMPMLTSKVNATIVKQDREDKVIVVKYKRKIRYKRKLGHKQDYTQVKIDSIA